MNVLEPRDVDEWRSWLAAHGGIEREIWLIRRRKGSGTPTLSYEEMVSHALCYGWIDSHARKYDEQSSVLRFTPRTARSKWSAPNRSRAARMIAAGLMTPAGQSVIDAAKADGRWENRAA